MATIYDVAKRANVSPATVSNAFNRPHLIKADTHERILQAARDLNYTPNLFAKALAGGRTQMVGLLVPDIRYPYTATLARGIEDVLTAEGYVSVIASTDGDGEKERRLLQQLHRQGVDGFILVPAQYGLSEETLTAVQQLISKGVPVVLAGERTADERIAYVDFDSQNSTKEALDYLIQLGHRDIAFIGGRYTEGVAVSRWLGYQESLLKNRVPLRPELVIETNMTPDDGARALAHLLTLENPPTAVFALNDLLAMGVIDLCYERQIRIPEQLSIVSFDYQPMARRTTPAVTSVVVSTYELGQKAAESLLHLQQPSNGAPAASVPQLILPHRLAIRQTTAARQ
ncbi:MAG: LacI family DNA-binding transcriptional regulator [Anaerolineales bacterium]|nr:LacI family DNA-binding transcriptional regulator [Anaerolineales bacterium]